MKKFLQVLFIISFALVSGVLSTALVFIVAWLNNFDIEGIAARLWLVASFLVEFIVTLVLAITLPTKVIGVNKFIFILLFIMVISSIAHQFAINSRILGTYYLPPGFSTAKMTNEELEKLVFDRNTAIGFQAFLDLKKRGAEASASMMHFIQQSMADDPNGSIDMPMIQEAVEVLAKQKDERMIPILQKMLKSNEYYDSYYRGKYIKTYSPTRIFAKKLLKKYFGIESDVETERVVNPKIKKR